MVTTIEWSQLLALLKKHGGIEVFLVVLLTAVLVYAESFIYSRFYKRCVSTQRRTFQSFLSALHLPLKSFIWLLGSLSLVHILSKAWGNTFVLNSIPTAKSLSITLLIVWFLVRFIEQIKQQTLNQKQSEDSEGCLDPTTVHALSQLVRIAIVIVASVVILQILGIPISGVLAFGGIGGFAVGFASKDLLANFFGSVMIFLDKPFKIGDWIRSPDKNIEGTVEYIGWRLTRIRTFDKRPLYVPNAVFLSVSVENPSRMKNRRIKTVVGVRYEDANKIEAMLKAIETMLRQHDDIDTRQTLFVKLIEFGPSSLNFLIYTFTKTTDWVTFQGVQQEVFLKILDIISAHGAECAFPTSTLHIKSKEVTL